MVRAGEERWPVADFAFFGVWALNQRRTKPALSGGIKSFKAVNMARFSKTMWRAREGLEGELHMVAGEVGSSRARAQGLGAGCSGAGVQGPPALLWREKTQERKPTRSVPTWVTERRQKATQLDCFPAS